MGHFNSFYVSTIFMFGVCVPRAVSHMEEGGTMKVTNYAQLRDPWELFK